MLSRLSGKKSNLSGKCQGISKGPFCGNPEVGFECGLNNSESNKKVMRNGSIYDNILLTELNVVYYSMNTFMNTFII